MRLLGYALRSRLSLLSTGVVIISLTACSSNTVTKSQNLSASSVAYTETVNELLDETIKQVINVDSKILVRTRNGTNPRKMLEEKNAALQDLIGEINTFRGHTVLMNSYFLNLQGLADSELKTDVGVNVGRISSRIHARSSGEKAVLTESEEGYISKIGSMMIGSYYAANIKAALKRDAPIIAKQLLLQEKQLAKILGILQDRLDTRSRMYLYENVVAPYIDTKGQHFDESTWVESRRQWFELQQSAPIFASVKEAHEALRQAWEDILRGKRDIGAVDMMLVDVNDFLETLDALDESRDQSRSIIQ